jgi:hypothetical protein
LDDNNIADIFAQKRQKLHRFFQDIWPKEKEVKNMKNTRNFLYLLACHDAKYFKKIYGDLFFHKRKNMLEIVL